MITDRIELLEKKLNKTTKLNVIFLILKTKQYCRTLIVVFYQETELLLILIMKRRVKKKKISCFNLFKYLVIVAFVSVYYKRTEETL